MLTNKKLNGVCVCVCDYLSAGSPELPLEEL